MTLVTGRKAKVVFVDEVPLKKMFKKINLSNCLTARTGLELMSITTDMYI